MKRIEKFFTVIRKPGKPGNFLALYHFYRDLDISEAISNDAFIQTIVDVCKKTALDTLSHALDASTKAAFEALQKPIFDAFPQANLREIISIVKEWDIITWYAVWWLSETNDPDWFRKIRRNPRLTYWNIYEWLHLLAGSITAFFKVEPKTAYYASEIGKCDLNWCVSVIAPTILAIRDAHKQSSDWILAFFFVCNIQARRTPDTTAVFPNAQDIILSLERWIIANAGRRPANIYIETNKIWSCEYMKEPKFVEEDFQAKWIIFDMRSNLQHTLSEDYHRMEILERTKRRFLNPFNPDDTSSVASQVSMPTLRALALNSEESVTNVSCDIMPILTVDGVGIEQPNAASQLLLMPSSYSEGKRKKVIHTLNIAQRNPCDTPSLRVNRTFSEVHSCLNVGSTVQTNGSDIQDVYRVWISQTSDPLRSHEDRPSLMLAQAMTERVLARRRAREQRSQSTQLQIQANPANTASAARIYCTCNVADCPQFHSKHRY